MINNIAQCQLCQSQLPLPAKPIVQFSDQSKILLAGQAPGIITHHQGIPFDDKSGERLRDWLGISNADFYDDRLFAIVPMGFCYPGKGKSGDLPPLLLCADTWRETIMSELGAIKLIVLIGKYAIDWHLAKLATSLAIDSDKTRIDSYKNITTVVQDWQFLLQFNLIALPHPSPRNNIWLKKNPWFEQEVLPQLQTKVKSVLGDTSSRASFK